MLINSSTKIGLDGNPLPPEGQRGIPFTFTFTSAAQIQENLSAQQQQGLISFAKSIYIDNSLNPNPVVLVFGGVGAGFSITAKGNTQGWYPVIQQRPIIFSISCAAAAGTTVLWIVNYDVEPGQWATA